MDDEEQMDGEEEQGGMRLHSVTVTDITGAQHPAHAVLCPECGCALFTIYVVYDHQHIGCVLCGTAYCERVGDCGMDSANKPH